MSLLSSRTTAPRARVLSDLVGGTLARDAALVVAGAAVTGIAAQVAIPLPAPMPPLTLQTFAVLVLGAAMGWRRGVASMTLYAVAGVAGMPWFAGGQSGFGGGSFGYVLGFILAAGLLGGLAERRGGRSFWRSVPLMVLGSVAVYAVGIPWLMGAAHLSLAAGLANGLVPFIAGDILKALAAAGVLPGAWALVRRANRGRQN